MGSDTPIDEHFFNAAFNSPLKEGTPKYKWVTNEIAMDIISESLKWMNEIYLPKEKEMEDQLGRPLSFSEQISLYKELKYK